MAMMELNEQETEKVRIMRLPPAALAAEQRAKHEARMTPEQRAERERLMALSPDVRRAEALLRQKLSVEASLRSGRMAAVLRDEVKVAMLSPENRAEAEGFLKRGTPEPSGE
jgi:hypothetical protein